MLNVFERYQTPGAFLRHLIPEAFNADRGITAFCLPIEVLGLILTAAVLHFWSRNPPNWQRWSESRRRDSLLRLIALLYCPLLLLQITTSLLIDLDGIWDLRILAVSGVRAFCPLIHSLDVSTKVAVALTLVLIAWRTHRLTSSVNDGVGYWSNWCGSFPCDLYPVSLHFYLCKVYSRIMLTACSAISGRVGYWASYQRKEIMLFRLYALLIRQKVKLAFGVHLPADYS